MKDLSKFNHKRRYKTIGGNFEGWHDELRAHAIEEMAEFNQRIEPVFHREGRYFDRFTRCSWEEFKMPDGTVMALADRPGSGDKHGEVKSYFMHCLSTVNHRPLRRSVRTAIGTLIDAGLVSWKGPGKRLWDLARVDDHWHELRRIFTDTRLHMMKFEREQGIERKAKRVVRRVPSRSHGT